MAAPRDPFPGRPQEQTQAGVAAAVGVVTSLLKPVLDIPDDVQQDVVYLCVTYGGLVVGQGTILRWRRLSNERVVEANIARADRDDAPGWQELPRRYLPLVTGVAALGVALTALALTLAR